MTDSIKSEISENYLGQTIVDSANKLFQAAYENPGITATAVLGTAALAYGYTKSNMLKDLVGSFAYGSSNLHKSNFSTFSFLKTEGERLPRLLIRTGKDEARIHSLMPNSEKPLELTARHGGNNSIFSPDVALTTKFESKPGQTVQHEFALIKPPLNNPERQAHPTSTILVEQDKLGSATTFTYSKPFSGSEEGRVLEIKSPDNTYYLFGSDGKLNYAGWQSKGDQFSLQRDFLNHSALEYANTFTYSRRPIFNHLGDNVEPELIAIFKNVSVAQLDKNPGTKDHQVAFSIKPSTADQHRLADMLGRNIQPTPEHVLTPNISQRYGAEPTVTAIENALIKKWFK